MNAFGSPRGILVAVVVLASTALVFVVGAQYRATQAAAESVIRGQADALFSAIRLRLPDEPTAESLEEVLADQHADGLRYVALESRPGPARQAPVEAGTALMRQHLRPGDLLIRSDRVRGSARPLPLRPPPPPHLGHPPIGPRFDHVVIEFEPLAWTELAIAAQRQLIGGVFVLFALLLTLLVGWRALGRAKAQSLMLEKQKRLAMLGEMSATLAHEIRNPLTSLKGHAQLLVEDASEERDRSRARRIVTEAIRLEALTSDLLTFLRSGDIAIADRDPVALVEDVRDGEPRVKLVTNDAPGSWPFDAPRLRQALANLMENALQAGEGEVSISVTTTRDVLRFQVDDRGHGIDESIRERLFDPFVTSRTRGTGLGLAVALRIAEAHGGTITAENRDGGGARFVLTARRNRDE